MLLDHTTQCQFAAHDGYSASTYTMQSDCSDKLDAALKSTFPASDPVAQF